jgi:ABC-type multidrug transport system ATPase subunit
MESPAIQQGPSTSHAEPDIAISGSNAHDSRPSIESEGNQISFREVDPVTVRVRKLSVSLDSSPPAAVRAFSALGGKSAISRRGHAHVKTILQDVSADFPSGSLTAILGASGSGKSSLLNVMSERMHGGRLVISGDTFYNGNNLATVRSAYVMQQDVLQPTLTVRETLRYAADLRGKSSVGRAERHQVVEQVIQELGLKEAANTRIGNQVHRGCSGGEKRRTSIAVQVRRLWHDQNAYSELCLSCLTAPCQS